MCRFQPSRSIWASLRAPGFSRVRKRVGSAGVTSSRDLLGDGLGASAAGPSWDVDRKGAGTASGGDDENVIGRGDEGAQPRLVAGLDRPGHALGAFQVRVRVLRVLEDELPDLLLAPAVAGDRSHMPAGEHDRVARLYHHVARYS